MAKNLKKKKKKVFFYPQGFGFLWGKALFWGSQPPLGKFGAQKFRGFGKKFPPWAMLTAKKISPSSIPFKSQKKKKN